jgi:glycosyltransferase involved in cell wall biosynthesis
VNVTVIPGDDAACGRYRLRWPAEAAARVGANVTLQKHSGGFYNPPEGTDVLVIQRPMTLDADKRIEAFHKRGISVVVDIDDAFWALNPRHVAYWQTHPKRSPLNTQHVAQWCKACDLVTATTPVIAARLHGKHGARVIPNCLPAAALEVGRVALQWQPDRPVVGWAGFLGSHAGDLRVLAPLMLSLDKLVVLGHPLERNQIASELGVSIDRVEVDGPFAINDYQPALAQLHIGLVPLVDNVFNRAKSALKMLEYAAAAAAPIASPTPDNKRVAIDGIGKLVNGKRDWARAVRELQGAALEEARWWAWERAARHTIEANVERWIDAWQEAHDGKG